MDARIGRVLLVGALLLSGCQKQGATGPEGNDGGAGASSSNGDGSRPGACLDLGVLSGDEPVRRADEGGSVGERCYELSVPDNGALTTTLTDLSETSVAFGLYSVDAAGAFASHEAIASLPSRDGTSLEVQLPPDEYLLRVWGGAAEYTLNLAYAPHPVAGPDADPLPKPSDETYELGTEKTTAVGGYVGPLDAADFYKITAPDNGVLDVAIADLTGGSVGFGVTCDLNGNGEFSANEMLAERPSRDSLSFSIALEPRDYFVRVVGNGATYTLKTTFTTHPVAGPAKDPANKPIEDTYQLDTAKTEAIGGYVGTLDPDDFYRIEVEESGMLDVVIADLKGGNVAFGIVQDKNSDGELALPDDEIYAQPSRNGLSFSRDLEPGTYFVRVTGDGANYTLKTTFTPATE